MAVATKRFVPGPLRRWLGAQLAGWTVAQWRRDEARVVQALGTNVAAGPFAGMRYLEVGSGSSLGPKLAGTYELEICDALEAAIAGKPTLILNAGCDEGYYAVGLLIRLPRARCIAWDRSELARDRGRQLASINGVADRLELRAEATATAIQECLGDAERVLIICDIEGGEVEVLDPTAAPQLRRCTIIAELHEHLRPGLTSVLAERFKPSHHVELIKSRSRGREDIPDEVREHLHDWRSAIDERRITEQQWMVANMREL
ncbi:MAG: hypothetical protein ACREVK_04090 [Gammaproteobacteria bacterium]